MADRTAASDSRHGLILASPSPPPPGPEDNPGSDTSIPLSPQWLLPKLGESKHGNGNEDDHSGLFSNNARRLDTMNSFKNGEEIGAPLKKKDVFRPSLLDQETNRCDRWRDEERDTNSLTRRDRWGEGDKETSDTRKADRWADNSAGKHYGGRATSDRWGDSANRDTGYERRESKWTNRWRPNDKDKEVSHEKSLDFGREGDMLHDKGLPNPTFHGKDDTEGDTYRPWRSNSSQSRGKGELPQSQNLTPNKGTAFSYGRGRSDNPPPTFSHGRGTPNVPTSGHNFSGNSQFAGLVAEKADNVHGGSSSLRYSRAKLLDVYRTMDPRASKKLLDDFHHVLSLTQEEMLEPLGLSAPSSDEVIILTGMDRGEILSSGAPSITKEVSAGWHPSELSQSRRPKFGSKEDLPHAIDAINDSSGDVKEDYTPYRKPGEIPASKDSGLQRNTYVPPGSAWRAPSLADHARTLSLEGRDASGDIQSNNHNMGRTHLLKDPTGDQSSVYPDRQHESRRLLHPSPEELVLFYKDPQGNIQGPFSGSDIIGWYEVGYFGIDLQVRLAGASNDQPFSLLGDVMPHLRLKARPPPGFNVPKQIEPQDLPSRLRYSNSGNNLLANSVEIDPLKNNLRHLQGFSTDADNRFLESLMSGPQGMGGNSTAAGAIGLQNDNLYLMAKKISLEQQRSSSDTYPFWPGRELATTVPKPEIGLQSPSIPSNLQSSMVDNIRSTPQSQTLDLLAMLQGLPERSSSGINSLSGSWSNFPAQGSIPPFTDSMGFNQGQNVCSQPTYGFQQRPQLQNNPSMINLLPQSTNNPAGVLIPENIMSSGLPQDPQTLSLLQQQYLLQLQSQTAAPMEQLSTFDQLLLLKQQQKQEEELNLLRQQQILAQNLSESLPHQQLGMSSYGHMQASATPGANIDQLQYLLAQEQLNGGPKISVPNVQDLRDSNMLKLNPQEDTNLNPQVLQDVTKLNSQVLKEVTEPNTQTSQEASKSNPQVLLEDTKLLNPNVPQEVAELNPHIPPEVAIMNPQVPQEVTKINLKVPQEVTKSNPQVRQGSSRSAESSSMQRPPQFLGEATDPKTWTNLCERLTELRKRGETIMAEIAAEKSSKENNIEEPSLVKNNETQEVKKGSEKKSRKKKSSKSSTQPNKQLESEMRKPSDSDVGVFPSGGHGLDPLNQAGLTGSANMVKDGGSKELNAEQETEGLVSQDSQVLSGQRAWKPAPGVKPKSLLEIQQEEQRRAKAEVQSAITASSANSTSLPTPWAGIVANTDGKSFKGNYIDAGSTESKPEKLEGSLKSVTRKSQLHSQLSEEVSVKSNVEAQPNDIKCAVPENLAPSISESTYDADFIEAKDTKKSRKKTGKNKGGNPKVVAVSPDVTVGSSPNEKNKSSRQQESEVLPAVPSGPSFGDFVVWKGDSTNPSSAPVWSTDSGKTQPILLRDILKEQGKKASPVLNQVQVSVQKPQAVSGSGPSWSPGTPSLSKSAVPVLISSQSTQSKYSGDDDLFWGPIDSSKSESRQFDFPQLANQTARGVKSSTPIKGSIGGLSKQKSAGRNRTADYSLSPSPATSLKGRKDTMSKQSEAMDFRDWCEAESVRLTGTRDTSFLEFCLKQTRSEAEILLVENLGSFDPDHQFINQFLNYKELLPADVLDIAFQSQNDRKDGNAKTSIGTSGVSGSTQEATIQTGGKKKGKKGKKVSPGLLGFNVVSNRIMMGEIQTIDD